MYLNDQLPDQLPKIAVARRLLVNIYVLGLRYWPQRTSPAPSVPGCVGQCLAYTIRQGLC